MKFYQHVNGLINLIQPIMLDFKSYTKSLTSKYLVIEQIKGILLQHLKLNWPICPLQIFYLTVKI